MESKPKVSAVWIYFEKMDQVGAGYRVASCKDCGKAVKILKGITTNLMSNLRTKHPKIHEEMRQKNDEKKHTCKQSIQVKKFNPLRTVVAYMHQGNKYFTVRKQIIITSPAFTI